MVSSPLVKVRVTASTLVLAVVVVAGAVVVAEFVEDGPVVVEEQGVVAVEVAPVASTMLVLSAAVEDVEHGVVVEASAG